MYIKYLDNFIFLQPLVNKLKENKKFQNEFKKLYGEKETLEYVLFLPIQQLSYYQIYLKDIIKLTPNEHPDSENLEKIYFDLVKLSNQILEEYYEWKKTYNMDIKKEIQHCLKQINSYKDKERISYDIQSLFKRFPSLIPKLTTYNNGKKFF